MAGRAGLSVIVLHGAVPPEAPPDEQDTLVQAGSVARALEALGHRAEAMALTLDLGAAKTELEARRPDVVFNLVESVEGRGALIHLGVGLAEALGLACTGAGTGALLNTSNKLLAKRMLALAGLPTPRWFEAGGPGAMDRPGPWIVKSVWEHGSIGIEDDGIVNGAEVAADHLAQRASTRGGEWFAEEFIDGREFNVAMLASPRGPEVLPIGEIHFEDWPGGKPRIVNYAAKWREGSFEFEHTPRGFRFPPGDTALLGELRRLALACWRLFDLRGHARVDFRVDGAGRPWILEVNANPCISPDSGFAAMLAEAGIGYEEAVARIVVEALTPPGAGLRAAEAPRTAPRTGGGPKDDVQLREDPEPADREAVRGVVAATGFFSAAEVAIAVELVDERLARGRASGYEFVLAERAGELVGYACYGPVSGTASSWDLYWIVVAPGEQGRGLGRCLLARTEERVRAAGGRRLYADTSARAQYAPTRAFYAASGFVQVAYLPDFYGPGDGKVVYEKVVYEKEVTAG